MDESDRLPADLTSNETDLLQTYAQGPPAAALLAAQIELSRQTRWRDPYYWAAFQLQGEWK